MANAVLYDILHAIRADVQALNLPGLAAANVVVQKVPSDRTKDLPAVKFPCLVIAPYGAETIDPEAGSNLRDDVVYPVLVAVIAAEGNDDEQPLDQQTRDFNLYLTWRERLRKNFSQQRLSTELCFKVEVQPLDIVDRTAWFERNVFSSGLLLKCYSRESRG